MIYLSRLTLDPMSRQVQRELASPYEMHRTLCHAFPGLSKEEWTAARVLFRADEDAGRLHLLVQSKAAPDWDAFRSHLGDKRYWLDVPQVKTWEPHFEAGQSLRFRLLANPTFRPRPRDGSPMPKNITRQGLYREAERLDWLLHRGRREYGFDLPTFEETLRARLDKNGEVVPLHFRGEQPKERRELTLTLPCVEVVDLNDGRRFPLPGGKNPNQFSAARFDGVLQVTDADKFTHALENGVGPGRGFGFGLLSLARA